MLGISPSAIERLAPPEGCGEGGCVWRSDSRSFVFVADESGVARACEASAVIITRVPLPTDFSTRCAPSAIIDDLSTRGGGIVYESDNTLRIERAHTPYVQRPWTPRGLVQE